MSLDAPLLSICDATETGEMPPVTQQMIQHLPMEVAGCTSKN